MNEAGRATFLWVDDDEAARPPVAAPVAAPTASPARAGIIPAEAGLWVFVLGDMTLFGAFFAVFTTELSKNRDLFERSATALHPSIGAVNTLLLLVSSYLVLLALRGRRSQGAPGPGWLVGAMACGGAFMVSKGVEYTLELSAGNTPATGTFFTFYYVLTGFPLLHVMIGVTLLAVWWRGARRAKAVSRTFREGAAVYWHMVDLLWLVIFALVYLGSGG
jgi:nitric oxide reductase NorE protein